MAENNGKKAYEVSIPIYQFITEGQITLTEDNLENNTLDINSLDEFDSIRYETSNIHLNSSLFFAEEAKRIENIFDEESELPEEDNDVRLDTRLPIGNRHDIYVILSVISSISTLEALVNEFYDRHAAQSSDAGDHVNDDEYISDPRFYESIENFDTVENRDFEYKPVLKKYQYLLAFADSTLFDRGKQPYQDVSLVNRFRNHLIHAQTEWIDSDEVPNIGESLEGKFETNPLSSDLPHPRPYLSFDCAKWCIESILKFLDEFYVRVDVKPPTHINSHSGDIWDYDSIISVEESTRDES